MIKTVGIVSLSSGILGEESVAHELRLGLERLKNMGLHYYFLPHALKGMAYLSDHPEKRAEDLISAFADDRIDMILCAIGGNDTYRLLPSLFENDALKNVVSNKIFLGFSDSTANHFVLHNLGVKSFYGQSFLADVCELDKDMLPYTLSYFQELVQTGKIAKLVPSPVWYEERKDYGPNALGTSRMAHENLGFDLLKGAASFSGPILGGCLETIYDMLDNSQHEDSVALSKKYHLFPDLRDWEGKILLLESSAPIAQPDYFRKMLLRLKETGIFAVINGLLVGRPVDGTAYDVYKSVLLDVIDTDIPIVYNLNVGHATPRAILPFGVLAHVTVDKQEIIFDYDT